MAMKVATLERLGEFLAECKALFASRTDVVDLQAQLDSKATSSHTHTTTDVIGAVYYDGVVTVDSGERGKQGTLDAVLSLVEGVTYRVVFNGTEYECVLAYKNDGAYLCLGNANLLSSGAEDTGEPFCVWLNDTTNSTLLFAEEYGDYSLKIYTEIKGLPEVAAVDNGKVLTVEDGEWKAADANQSVLYAASAGSAESATKATQDASGNTITSTYETKDDATAKLDEAKEYTDTVAVPNTRTVNSKALSDDITLTATDIGGYMTTASGANSQAIGFYSTASGVNAFAQGYYANAAGYASSSQGYQTIANDYQAVVGKFNTEKNPPATADTQDSGGEDAIFIVGYGTSTTRGNAFRISSNGKCRGVSTFSGSGADFAELFEWADGNPNNEDRRGLFVTLEGEKIRLANADDDYIGVISGAQAFIGNSASEEWQGKYLTDVFGTKLSQEIEVPEKIDETTGEVITPATTTTQYVLNPDYNPNEKYVMRENRKEWGIVGLLGQVVIIDDGTGVVGGYVKPSVNGIGTAASNGYRVMKRIDESHIKVLVK